MHNETSYGNMRLMKRQIVIKFIPDPEGFFSKADVDGVEFSAFGLTPETAQEAIARKIKHFLHPTAAPLPREIEI